MPRPPFLARAHDFGGRVDGDRHPRDRGERLLSADHEPFAQYSTNIGSGVLHPIDAYAIDPYRPELAVSEQPLVA